MVPSRLLHLFLLGAAAGSFASNPRLENSVSVSIDLNVSAVVDSSVEASETPTSSKVHRVIVGAGGDYRFRPSYIIADIGDIVKFHFLALNHTVTSSSLLDPCIPSDLSTTGFYHYNRFNRSNDFEDFLVTRTDPQWFFCQQKEPISHCSRGMVFAINPRQWWAEFLIRAEGALNSSVTDSSPESRSASSPVATTHAISGAAHPSLTSQPPTVTIQCINTQALPTLVSGSITQPPLPTSRQPERTLPSVLSEGTDIPLSSMLSSLSVKGITACNTVSSSSRGVVARMTSPAETTVTQVWLVGQSGRSFPSVVCTASASSGRAPYTNNSMPQYSWPTATSPPSSGLPISAVGSSRAATIWPSKTQVLCLCFLLGITLGNYMI